ncbi:MAG: septum formation initiator family protein [bacterium]
MFNRNKHRLTIIITSQIFISLILLGLFVFLLTPTIKNYRQQRQIDQEIATLKQQVAEAEKKNNDFQKMLDYLQSDSFTQEQARVNLGLKQSGEKVVVITDSSEQTEAEKITTEAASADSSLFNSQAVRLLQNLQKWLDYFFGLSLLGDTFGNPETMTLVDEMVKLSMFHALLKS